MTDDSQTAHEAAVKTVRECFIHAEAHPLSIWAEQHRYVANLADAALVGEQALLRSRFMLQQWNQAAGEYCNEDDVACLNEVETALAAIERAKK